MSSSAILLAFAISQLGLAWILIYSSRGEFKWIDEPITWFYSTWILGLLLLSLPIYIYPESPSTSTVIYLCLMLTSFATGVLICEFSFNPQSRLSKRESAPTERTPLNATIFLILGCAGTALLLVNSYLSGELSIADRLGPDAAQMIRDQFLGEAANKIGPLYGLANPFASVGVIGLTVHAFRHSLRQYLHTQPACLCTFFCECPILSRLLIASRLARCSYSSAI
jgi:hypothetical protein